MSKKKPFRITIIQDDVYVNVEDLIDTLYDAGDALGVPSHARTTLYSASAALALLTGRPDLVRGTPQAWDARGAS